MDETRALSMCRCCINASSTCAIVMFFPSRGLHVVRKLSRQIMSGGGILQETVVCERIQAWTRAAVLHVASDIVTVDNAVCGWLGTA